MLIPAQKLNKTNCKIQDYFTNRQTKEDVKCNTHHLTIVLSTELLLMTVFNNGSLNGFFYNGSFKEPLLNGSATFLGSEILF
jgi:hypothetical protein